MVAGWNSALPHHQLTAARFREVFLADPNQEPEGLLVAEEEHGGLLGFAACTLRRTLEGRDGRGTAWEFPRAYLRGIYVAEGAPGAEAGACLLAAAEAYAAEAGKRTMMVTVYTGRYVFPGIDLRYERLRELLAASRYRDVDTIEDVAVDLRAAGLARRLEEARQRCGPEVEVLVWEPGLLPALRAFVAEGQMPQWFPVGWEVEYGQADPLCLVLRRGKEILGWARYSPRPPTAGFGPILVLERARGLGYGLRLLCECMARARESGCETMSAGWANTGFYVRAGWEIRWRYAVFTKELGGGA